MVTINLAGLPVQITLPFAAFVVLALLLDSDRTALYAIAASIVHETGHLFTLSRLRCAPQRLRLTLSGAEIKLDPEKRMSYIQECIAAASGPAINAALGVLLIAVWHFTRTAAALHAGLVSLTLGAFNLLPVAPLDGGQILACLLNRFFSPLAVDLIMRAVSFVVLVPVAVAGFLFLLRSRYQFSLFLTAVYLIYTMFEK